MNRTACAGLVLLAALGIASAASSSTHARYEAKVAAQSPTAIHPPYFDGTFWLGDYMWLYFRDRSLSLGAHTKYRVCWSYESFSGAGCKNGLASRGWQKFPPRIKNRFNSHMTVTWLVNGAVVVKKRLRITGE